LQSAKEEEEEKAEDKKADEDKNEEDVAEPAVEAAVEASQPAPAQGMPSIRDIMESEDEEEDDDDDDDDFEDESLAERLAGLAEMFPDGFTDGCVNMAKGSVNGVKWLYSTGRGLTWVVFSTASVLFLPVIIETQLLEIEEAAKQQQRQILLGPGSAVSAGQNAPLPKAPV